MEPWLARALLLPLFTNAVDVWSSQMLSSSEGLSKFCASTQVPIHKTSRAAFPCRVGGWWARGALGVGDRVNVSWKACPQKFSLGMRSVLG